MKRGMSQNPRRAKDAQCREETVKLLVEQKKICSICTLHSRRPTVHKIQSEVLSLFKQKTASRSAYRFNFQLHILTRKLVICTANLLFGYQNFRPFTPKIASPQAELDILQYKMPLQPATSQPLIKKKKEKKKKKPFNREREQKEKKRRLKEKHYSLLRHIISQKLLLIINYHLWQTHYPNG